MASWGTFSNIKNRVEHQALRQQQALIKAKMKMKKEKNRTEQLNCDDKDRGQPKAV